MTRLPGIILCFALAYAAMVLHEAPFAPFTIGDKHPLDEILLAIILGMVVRAFIQSPAWAATGVKFSVKKLLPVAIVLMGAKLNFHDVIAISGQALWINLTCVITAISLTLWICMKTGIGQKLAMLIAIGTGICGGTAIVVSAPIIEADDRDTAFAVAAVTLYGLLSIVIFPAIGSAVAMTDYQFGVWSGTAIHATPQVVAAGYSFSETAGDIATIVKLVRVLLLAPLVILLGLWVAREKRKRQEVHIKQKTRFSSVVPNFVIGFVALAIANTAYLLPDFTLHLKETFLWQAGDKHVSVASLSTSTSSFLIMMAMAGIGLGIDLRGLAKTGLKALRVGLIATIILASFSFVLVTTFL